MMAKDFNQIAGVTFQSQMFQYNLQMGVCGTFEDGSRYAVRVKVKLGAPKPARTAAFEEAAEAVIAWGKANGKLSNA